MRSLLEVADNHPDVIKTDPNKPAVYFRLFGDSSLHFELWCIISDVNKKDLVRSALHLAINKIFAERSIVIAFPQLDVHVVST